MKGRPLSPGIEAKENFTKELSSNLWVRREREEGKDTNRKGLGYVFREKSAQCGCHRGLVSET